MYSIYFIVEIFKLLSGSQDSAPEEIGAVLPGNSLSKPDPEVEPSSDAAEVSGDNPPLWAGERTWGPGGQ